MSSATLAGQHIGCIYVEANGAETNVDYLNGLSVPVIEHPHAAVGHE